MNKKQKEENLEVFVEAFHEVLVPVLETLATKEDLKKLDARVNTIEEHLNTVEENLGNKIDTLNRRLITITDHQADKMDSHEKRIQNLEAKTLLP